MIYIVLFILGSLCGGLSLVIYHQNKEIDKLKSVDSDIPLDKKIIKLVENNIDEFEKIVCCEVEVVFNPSTQEAMTGNLYSVEENTNSFFNDISDDLSARTIERTRM